MGNIVICGASGSLGGFITAEVLKLVPPSKVTLTTRTPGNLAHRAAQGVKVCRADYTDLASLEEAFQGGDTLMLISGLTVTQRVPEHQNAIAAAKKAGISHIVYTSTAGVHPKNPALSASEHAQTEDLLRASGLGYTALRNQSYSEIFAEISSAAAKNSGSFIWHEGEGMFSPVSKRDIARCAARILTNPTWHDGAIYEITGPELMTVRTMVEAIAEGFDIPIKYIPMTGEELLAYFDSLGVPRSYVQATGAPSDFGLYTSDELVTGQRSVGEGFHEILTGHVKLITGQEPISFKEVVKIVRAEVESR